MTITNDRVVDNAAVIPDFGHACKNTARRLGHFIYIDETHVLDSDQHTENRVTITNLAGAIIVNDDGSDPVPFQASFKRTYTVSTINANKQQTPTTALTHLVVGEGEDDDVRTVIASSETTTIYGYDMSVIETAVRFIANVAHQYSAKRTRHTAITQQLNEALAAARRKYNHSVVLGDIEFLRDADVDGECCVKVRMRGKISIDHSSAYVPFRILCDIDINDDDDVLGIQTFGVHLTNDYATPIFTSIDKEIPNMHILGSPQTAMSSIIFLLAMKAKEYLRTV